MPAVQSASHLANAPTPSAGAARTRVGDEGERDYREDERLADAEERFGIPVTFAEISH